MPDQSSRILSLFPRNEWVPLADITIPSLITAFVHLVMIIAGIAFVFSILTGGIKLMLTGGDRERLDNAKRQLTGAFAGIFVVFATWAVMSFVGEFFGVDLMVLEIPQIQ